MWVLDLSLLSKEGNLPLLADDQYSPYYFVFLLGMERKPSGASEI